MKQIKFLTTAFLMGLLFIGCSSDDSNPSHDPNNPASGFSRIDFTITGSDHNGSFTIIDDLNTQEIYTSGVVYHTEEGDLVNFGYSDDIQEISAGFTILGGTGTQNFSRGSLQDGFFALQLAFYTQTDFSNSNTLYEKNLTVTVTEYETEPGFIPSMSELKRIKGTFSGTVMTYEEFLGENQNTHTIEGTFYYVMPND